MPSMWRACSQSFRSLSSASISFFTWSITCRQESESTGISANQDYTFSYMLSGDCWGYQDKQKTSQIKTIYTVNIDRCMNFVSSRYVYIYMYIHLCMSLSLSIYISIYTRIYIYIYMQYIHVNIHTVYTCICTFMYLYM